MRAVRAWSSSADQSPGARASGTGANGLRLCGYLLKKMIGYIVEKLAGGWVEAEIGYKQLVAGER